jgi:ribosomal protein S12 methylthiotransferase accessory factor
MLQHPTFKRHYQVQRVPGVGVFLVSERGGSVLRGRSFEAVTPLLDGRLSADAIVERVAEDVGAAEAYYALMELEARGYLAEATDGLPVGAVALWHSLGLDPAGASRRLPGVAVGVESRGGGDAAEFADALRERGFCVAPGERGDITVLLADDYLRPELAEVNARALESQQPWLLVKPKGLGPWVGPLFVPGTTACWLCLAQRLLRNRPLEGFLAAVEAETVFARVDPAVLGAGSVVEALVAAQLLRWVGAGSASPLIGSIYAYDGLDLTVRRHRVARRPQCAACGDAQWYTRQVARPVLVHAAQKAATEGRRPDSGDILRLREALVDPITGIVRRLYPVSAEADLVHLCAAEHGTLGRPAGPRAAQMLLQSGRSGGKGTTAAEAEASALGEAVERCSGVFQGDEPRIRATFQDLGDLAIHPNACMLFSGEQYRWRERWNQRGSSYALVAAPFDPRAAMDWTPVWSLTEQRHKFLPTMLLYYGYPGPAEEAPCWADSNGNACGPTREEAMLRGFLELIERDSVALWWYNRVQRPRLIVDTEHAYAHRLTQWYESLGREVWVLDLTADFAVPCFAAVSRRVGEAAERILLGFGAHFDPAAALTHALTEMNQMLAVDRSFGVLEHELDPEVVAWMRDASVAAHHYLLPNASQVALSSYADRRAAGSGEEVLRCQRLVTERSMEMLVLDQTRPDIGLPVVKIIVPGLRPFWARFAPGRLYDVPVALGWLAQPRTEAELNPVPFFF